MNCHHLGLLLLAIPCIHLDFQNISQLCATIVGELSERLALRLALRKELMRTQLGLQLDVILLAAILSSFEPHTTERQRAFVERAIHFALWLG